VNKQLLAATTAAILSTTALADFEGIVTRVIDGDTIEVLTDDKDRHRVRLMCIDAPETKQPYSNASKQKLNDFVGGKYVKIVESPDNDPYGRVLGTVNLAGSNVNFRMVQSGMAWDYVRFTCGANWAKAEAAARKAKRGLWKTDNPLPPWEYRNK